MKITPILIELPYYNISSQYKYYPTYKQFAYHALSILTDFNLEINNIERYRKKLRNTLNKQKIEFIRQFEEELYQQFKKDIMYFTSNKEEVEQ